LVNQTSISLVDLYTHTAERSQEVEEVQYATSLPAPMATLLLRHFGQAKVAIEQRLGWTMRCCVALCSSAGASGSFCTFL